MFIMKQVTSLGKEHAQAVLSQYQKFHKAQEVAIQLATLTSEVGIEEYCDHLTLLKLLKDKWVNVENVSLSSSSIGKSPIPYTCMFIIFVFIC